MISRALDLEIMDGADYEDSEYELTLRELQTINRWTMGYRPTLNALDRVCDMHRTELRERPLRILDIGFGYGDTLRVMEVWARARGIAVELTGVDLNPRAAELARAATPSTSRIRYLTRDVFDLPLSFETDVIVNALFMHHLADEQIVRLLNWMTERAGWAWFINDLHRHPVAYQFIKYATRICATSRLIRNDAPLSVARSFRRADWSRYLHLANNTPAEIRWHLPFRYGVFCDTMQARSISRLSASPMDWG